MARRGDEAAVTVVGAGPAGLACAIALARSGRRVAVREWHRHIGHRFHGDFQGLENWSDERDVLDELAAAGIAASFEHIPVREGTVCDRHGNRRRIRGERPLYYLVLRGPGAGTLDQALAEQAVAAGVDLRLGDRVQTANGTKVLAGGPRTADAIAVGYVFETDADDGDWLVLDDRLAPLGYAYLLVHGGRGTVASCMFSGFKKHAEHVARTVEFFARHAGLTMRNARPFGGFANFRLPRTAVQGGHLVVGEHAGFQDALAGFGLRYALRSGVLAARSIIEGVDYTRLWRRQLLPLLRAGIVNRFIFNVAGEPGRRMAVARLCRGDAGLALRRAYRPWALTMALYPIARPLYRAPLRDRSCDHIDCDCVWCQSRAEASTSWPSRLSTRAQ